VSNIVCCIIFGFLIILGVVDVIKLIVLNMFDFSKQTDETSQSQKTNLPVKIDSENIEHIIRSVLIQSAWNKNSNETKITCPNIGNETHKILSILIKDYPNIKVEDHILTIKA
jgi:hypothetical protein